MKYLSRFRDLHNQQNSVVSPKKDQLVWRDCQSALKLQFSWDPNQKTNFWALKMFHFYFPTVSKRMAISLIPDDPNDWWVHFLNITIII